MNNFKDDCNVCGTKDDTVWEIVHGVALCEPHQEAWFQSKMIVTNWVSEQVLQQALGDKQIYDLEQIS